MLGEHDDEQLALATDDALSDSEPVLASLARTAVGTTPPSGPELRRRLATVPLPGRQGVSVAGSLCVAEHGFSLHAATRAYPFREAHRDGTPRGVIKCGGAPLIRRARGGSASGAAAARLGRIARERQRRRGDGVGRRCGRLDVDVGQLGLPRANDDGAKPWLEGSSRLPPILRGELEHSQL